MRNFVTFGENSKEIVRKYSIDENINSSNIKEKLNDFEILLEYINETNTNLNQIKNTEEYYNKINRKVYVYLLLKLYFPLGKIYDNIYYMTSNNTFGYLLSKYFITKDNVHTK